jgi:O-antigen/teichoic acid export membrane protein
MWDRANPSMWRSHLRRALTRGLARSSLFIAITDQGVCSIGNFASGAILGRNSGPEQYGIYLLAFSVLLIAIDILAAFLTTPFTVAVPQMSAEGKRSYTGSVLLQVVGSCALVTLFMYAASALLQGLGDPKHYAMVMRLLTVSVGAILLREGLRRISFALLRFRFALVMDLAFSALQLSSLLCLLRLHRLSAGTGLGAAAAASLVGSAIWLSLMRRHLSFGSGTFGQQLKRSVRLGGWVFSSGLLWTLLTNAYVWIISAVTDYKHSALWGACLAITASCNPLFLGLQNYIGPRIAHACANTTAESISDCINKQILWFCATLLPFSSVLLFFGGAVVLHIYGPRYAGCEGVMVILSLNMLASAASFPSSRVLFSLDAAHFDFIVNAVALPFSIAVSIALIRTSGVFGAACSLLLTNCLAALARYLIARSIASRFPQRDEELVPSGAVECLR